MHTNFEDDPEDEPVTFVKIQSGQRGRVKRKPTRKASYESNVDVQRWLQEQQSVDEEETKPAFNPTFLAAQRDSPWILSSLRRFYEQDLITNVLHVVKSGKEATVYCCVAAPSLGAPYLAAKVYRPRMFRSLKNDAVYRAGREQRDVDGRVVHSRHQYSARTSSKGRAARVTSWIEYEYRTQSLLYEHGVTVPRPIAQIGNAVLMEYIGDVGNPAPLLHEVSLTSEEVQPLFESILRNVELSLSYGRIHGDLSEYNILYWQGAATLIDFAQAVDPHHDSGVYALFARDVARVCRFFARYGVAADARALAAELWARQMGPVYPI